ncbi:hypothetical protein DERP_007457, partial [Dermatophagoides pteronyssinus]
SIENWKRVQTLGSGTFATITLWVNKETDEKLALKQSYMDVQRFSKKEITYYNERWQQEIKLMKKLNCENVVKALELPKEFEQLSINNGIPILAMQYCSGGDLRKVLNESGNCCGLSEKEVREILKQIGSAINCLHNLNIVHRDLKPENIVLQPLPNDRILYKLTDLGFAKQLSETTSANSFVGTFAYSAPELFLTTPYTSSVDNWSFGVIAFEIVTGRRPFLPNHPVIEVLDAIRRKKPDDICTEIDDMGGNFYYSKEIPPINHIGNTFKSDLEQWLKMVLQFDPEKRGGRMAYKEIEKITNKKIIEIFSICSYETFTLEINEKTQLRELKEKIFSYSDIIPENQYLFYQNGDKLSEQIGEQIIQTWYQPRSWFERYNPIVINLFDYSKPVSYQEFYKFLCLPNRVEKMLMNVNGIDDGNGDDYDDLKLTWRNSVFVARQTVKKYRFIHNTLKSCLLNSLQKFNQLQNENSHLFNQLNQLFSLINFSEKLLWKNYQQNPEDGGAIDDYDDQDIRPILIKLKNLHEWRHQITEHFDQNQRIIPKFNKELFLFQDFFQSPEIDPELWSKYDDIQKAYDMLRKMKKIDYKESAFSNNNLMVKLLCDIFRLVEKLMKQMFSVLSILIEFLRNIRNQRENCQRIRMEFRQKEEFENDLEEFLFNHVIQRRQNRYHENSTSSTESTEMIIDDDDRVTTESHQNPEQPEPDQQNFIWEEFFEKFQKENLEWKSKSFDFGSLEFKDFLF